MPSRKILTIGGIVLVVAMLVILGFAFAQEDLGWQWWFVLPLALIMVVTMLVFRVTVQRKAEPAHETREAEGDADPSHDSM